MAEPRRLQVGLMPKTPEAMLPTRAARNPSVLSSKKLEPDVEKIKPVRNSRSKLGRKLATGVLAASLTFGSVIAPLAQTAPPKDKAVVELAVNKKTDKPVVELAQNTTPAKKLSPEQGSGPTQTQADANLPILRISDIEDSIRQTEKAVDKREMQEVKLNVDAIPGSYQTQAAEWTMSYARGGWNNLDTGGFVITNKLNPDTTAGYPRPDTDVLVMNSKEVDLTFVKCAVVQRPDDPSQTILILSSKDHFSVFILNNKKQIEWIPVPVARVGIQKKTSFTIEFGANEKGMYVTVGVFDENTMKMFNDGRLVKVAVFRIYPSLNDDGFSKVTEPVVLRVSQ